VACLCMRELNKQQKLGHLNLVACLCVREVDKQQKLTFSGVRGSVQMSVTLMVACLLQRFQFEPLHPMEVGYDITLNFQKTNGLHMRVRQRKGSSEAAPEQKDLILSQSSL
jgi:hypothetical protein